MSRRGAGVADTLDDRVGVRRIAERIRAWSLPTHRFKVFYVLGILALFLFAVQLATGVLLMFYYRPTAQEAHQSIEFLMTEVRYGWLVRSVHAWSANFLIFVAILHLVTVFFAKAYRKPRELTWVVGCLLLFLLLGFGFTGYLLPWNQLSFVATQVGVEMVRWVPLIGNRIARLLLGGQHVGGPTLIRLYALHVMVLPAMTLGLLAVHLYLVERHGVSIHPSVEKEGRPVPRIRYFPHGFLRHVLVWLLAVGVLLTLASLYPAPIGIKADPFAPAYDNIRPEWYFMFMFQTLRAMPAGEIAGLPFGAIPFLLFKFGGLLLVLVPLLDRGIGGMRLAGLSTVGALALAYVVGMTALGYRSVVPVVVAVAALGTLWLVIRVAGVDRRADR